MRSLRKQVIAIAALGALFAPLAARGETAIEPTLKIAAEERYDDAYLLRDGTGNGQLMSKLMPQLGLKLENHTVESDAWYSPDYLYHHMGGELTIDHRGRFDLKARLSRT